MSKQGYKKTEVGVIPEDWEVKRIEDIFDILDNMRIPLNKKERQFRNGKVPYYGANGLLDYVDEALFNEPLILLAEDGGNFDDFYNRPIAYRINGPSWVNNHAHVLKVKKHNNQSFFYWSLVNKDIRQFINDGTRTKLNQQYMKLIPLPYPPLQEQKKIAGILDGMDGAIGATEAIIAKLKQIKKGLLQDLLTRGIDKNGNLRHPKTHKFKQTPLGPIPEDWEVKKLGEVCKKIIDGTHHTPTYTKSGVPFLRVKDIKENIESLENKGIKFISFNEHEKLIKRCNPEKGDILLSKNGTVGRTMIIDWEFEFSIYVSLALIKLKSGNFNYFFEYILNSHLIKQQIYKRSKKGTVTNLHLEEIREFQIPLPPLQEQKQIAEILDQHDQRIQAEEEELQKLKTTKKGLMTDLLTGKVRVKV